MGTSTVTFQDGAFRWVAHGGEYDSTSTNYDQFWYFGRGSGSSLTPSNFIRIVTLGTTIDSGVHIKVYAKEATNILVPLEYSAPRENILINSDFAVNQRNYVNGTPAASGTGMYDRWVVWSTNSHMSVTGIIATIDHTTTSTLGRMYQGIEAGQIIPGKQYTLSWKGNATVSLWHQNGAAYDQRTSPYTFVAGADYNTHLWDYIVVSGDGATISELKLEEGTSATPWEKPDIPTELVRCQRYYWRTTGDASDTYETFGIGHATSSTQARILIPNPVTMRAEPVITPSGALRLFGAAAVSVSTLASTFGSNGKTSVVLATVASGLTAGHAQQLSANNSSATYIDFNAEL
jgi:hypothetical protein